MGRPPSHLDRGLIDETIRVCAASPRRRERANRRDRARLAGQHPDYLYAALKAYQTQNNAQVGRSNPVMGGMTANFTREQLKELAKYIGSLPGELQVVPQGRFR